MHQVLIYKVEKMVRVVRVMRSLSKNKLVYIKTPVTGILFDQAQTASHTIETFYIYYYIRSNYSPKKLSMSVVCACLPVHSSLLRFHREGNNSREKKNIHVIIYLSSFL